MAFTLYVFYGVPGGRLLKAEPFAELPDVEFEHPAFSGLIGDFIEDVELLVDVLNVLQAGESDLFYLFQAGDVRAVPEEDGVGGLSVTPGAPRFLEVGLRGIRDIGMDHKADVRLVNAHPEGVCAHHHAGFAAFPFLLAVCPCMCAQPGVVKGCFYAGAAELSR